MMQKGIHFSTIVKVSSGIRIRRTIYKQQNTICITLYFESV